MREIGTGTHNFTQDLPHMTARIDEKFIAAFDEFKEGASQEV